MKYSTDDITLNDKTYVAIEVDYDEYEAQSDSIDLYNDTFPDDGKRTFSSIEVVGIESEE